jgi:hypothetical protein
MVTSPPPHSGDVGLRGVPVRKPDGAIVTDAVAVEAPLEIRVNGRPLVITMRTPGHDEELAAGFLFAEGVVTHADQVVSIRTEPASAQPSPDELAEGKVGAGARVMVELRDSVDTTDIERARRDFRATAACGVCGKERLDDLEQTLPAISVVSTESRSSTITRAPAPTLPSANSSGDGCADAGSVRIETTWSACVTTPSANKNPAASSSSWPGVRIVITSGRPFTRISSGASTATASVTMAPSGLRTGTPRRPTSPEWGGGLVTMTRF